MPVVWSDDGNGGGGVTVITGVRSVMVVVVV